MNTGCYVVDGGKKSRLHTRKTRSSRQSKETFFDFSFTTLGGKHAMYFKLKKGHTQLKIRHFILFPGYIFFHGLLENEKENKQTKNQQQQQSYTVYFPLDNSCFVFSSMFRKSNVVIEKYYVT